MNVKRLGVAMKQARVNVFVLLSMMVAVSLPVNAQQTGGLPALERRVAELEAKVTALVGVNSSQSAAILALQTQLSAAEIRIAGIEGKLTFLTVTGSDMYITGANLHIVNGLGATNGYPTDPRSTDPNLTKVNGIGNLIIGYDGANVFSPGGRSGSHNLIVGDGIHTTRLPASSGDVTTESWHHTPPFPVVALTLLVAPTEPSSEVHSTPSMAVLAPSSVATGTSPATLMRRLLAGIRTALRLVFPRSVAAVV